MSSEKRSAKEMVVRVNSVVRAVLNLYRSEESVRQGRRVTDNEVIMMMIERTVPDLLERAEVLREQSDQVKEKR